MPHPFESRIRARLDVLESEGLRRTLRAPAGIDLSSNDYLGLSRHPRIAERMIEAVRREGCGSTGSRLLRGHREAFAAVERAFAAFKGTDAALYFSSGYLANLAVVTTFAGRGDTVLSDRLNHASLRDGTRLSPATCITFPHARVPALARQLERARSGQTFVLTESLFGMDGDVAPLDEYVALCRSAGALLIVDEAHAVGVYGNGGRGLVEHRGAPEILVSVNTAGKALGVAGAFVAGPAWAIDYLVQRARPFVFSTAAPPALAAALEASLAVVAAEPDRRAHVRALATRLRAGLCASGLPVAEGDSLIVPIVLGDVERTVAVARTLQAQGFDVRPIRPPTVPAGTARLRISVNASLTAAVIDRFIAALTAALGT